MVELMDWQQCDMWRRYRKIWPTRWHQDQCFHQCRRQGNSGMLTRLQMSSLMQFSRFLSAISGDICTRLFTQSVSSFRSTCPYRHNLFCCSINILSPSVTVSEWKNSSTDHDSAVTTMTPAGDAVDWKRPRNPPTAYQSFIHWNQAAQHINWETGKHTVQGRESETNRDRIVQQMVQVIWHKAASPPHMAGSITWQTWTDRPRYCICNYRPHLRT